MFNMVGKGLTILQVKSNPQPVTQKIGKARFLIPVPSSSHDLATVGARPAVSLPSLPKAEASAVLTAWFPQNFIGISFCANKPAKEHLTQQPHFLYGDWTN